MIRKLARPMLASFYIADGAEIVLNTSAHVEGTQLVLDRIRYVLPRKYAKLISKDPALVARAIGGTKVGAGSLLAIGRAPRTSAATLAILTIPTILARNAFWETQDAEEKRNRRNGFLTNIALLGGLFITSADTEGKPGVKWRATNAAKRSKKQLQQALPTKSETEKFGDKATDWFSDTSEKVTEYAHTAQDFVGENKDDWIKSATDTAHKVADSVSDYAHKASSYLEETSGEWLESAQANAKTARKSAVKAAGKAQDKANFALQVAEETTGRTQKKATKNYDKLQKQADKAIGRAQDKLKQFNS
ncbi:DoxX family protein [Corynebacterium crudilactis]|uniref:DoxX family protein n=1 Tax=Corynebacterium crudilactis TaxID=1652495 RepID=A0A172QTB8_9CORY|nr:DoxX family protein [Corynebacterium crudilactis]ANE03910.1 DoxX family protein [Corynebacterium crudilactis]